MYLFCFSFVRLEQLGVALYFVSRKGGGFDLHVASLICRRGLMLGERWILGQLIVGELSSP